MNLHTNQKGFTIVELLIVIVVIAILAAISIVAYTGIQQRARESAGQQAASQVANKANAYHAVEGSYPADVAAFASVEEAELEGVDAEDGTAAPAQGTDSDFDNGTSVYYNGSATGYTIYYKGGEITR